MKTRKFARLLSASLSVAALAAVPAVGAHATSGSAPDPNQENSSQQACQASSNNDYTSASGLIGIAVVLHDISILNGNGIGILGYGTGSNSDNQSANNHCQQAGAQQNKK